MIQSIQARETVASGLCGQLRLRFEKGLTGGSRLSQRFRSGLYHLSKPYLENNRLTLQVLNPTAGLFENDTLSARIDVGAEAHACLLSPSASQIYRMPGTGSAESCLQIHVGSGGSLVYLPHWSVLHAGARFKQRVRIDLADTASLLLVDQISAGRHARGEFLEFDLLHNSTDLYRNETCLLRERLVCGSDRNRWVFSAQKRVFSYLTTVYIGTPEPVDAERLRQQLEPHLPEEGCYQGVTEVAPGLLVFRILSTRATSASKAIRQVAASLPPAIRLPDVFGRIHL